MLDELLKRFDDKFCIEQFEEFTKDPIGYNEEIQGLIDEASPALKHFMQGLVAYFGPGEEKVLVAIGATIMLTLVAKSETKIQ